MWKGWRLLLGTVVLAALVVSGVAPAVGGTVSPNQSPTQTSDTAAGPDVRGDLGARSVNEPPNADAGRKKFADEDESVPLDGSGSSDPDGDDLTYQWRQVTEYDVTILGENEETALVTVHNISRPVTAEFELEVTDENGASDTDTVEVEVDDVETPTPTATPTPTRTPTSTPTPTATPAPTTPTSTPTSSPTPTTTPAPTSPTSTPTSSPAPTTTPAPTTPTPTTTPSPTPRPTPTLTPTPTPTLTPTPTATETANETRPAGGGTETTAGTGSDSSSDGLLGSGIGSVLVIAGAGVGLLVLAVAAGGVWWVASDDSDGSGSAGDATDAGPGTPGSSTAIRSEEGDQTGGQPDASRPGESGSGSPDLGETQPVDSPGTGPPAGSEDDSPAVGSPSSPGSGQQPNTADAGTADSPVGQPGTAREDAGQSSNTRIYQPMGGDAETPTEPPEPGDDLPTEPPEPDDDSPPDAADRPTEPVDSSPEFDSEGSGASAAAAAGAGSGTDANGEVEAAIERGDDHREDVQEYLTDGEFDRALDALSEASDAYEAARQVARDNDLGDGEADRIEAKLDETDDERHTVLERKATALTESARLDIEDVEELVADGEEAAAEDALNDLAAQLDTARTLVEHHGFDHLDESLSTVERRTSELRDRLH